MFTYVKAKNFKSLKNISFNLNKTKNETNKFIAIYGENGSGKTNLVELFKFLQQLTISRIIDVKLNMLPKEFFELKEKMIDTTPMDMKPIWQLSLNLDEYRMINEEEDTEIEYGFKINNKEGFYSVKFNKEIVEEKLYFFVNKQKGYYFKLSKNEKELNKNIFINEKYIVIADNDDFAERLVRRVIKRKPQQGPTKERFLYNFITEFLNRDLSLLNRYEKQIMRMEDQLMHGKMEDFQSKIMPIRKELLTLPGYYDELCDLGQELEEYET